jgi:hypothetical protein
MRRSVTNANGPELVQLLLAVHVHLSIRIYCNQDMANPSVTFMTLVPLLEVLQKARSAETRKPHAIVGGRIRAELQGLRRDNAILLLALDADD